MTVRTAVSAGLAVCVTVCAACRAPEPESQPEPAPKHAVSPAPATPVAWPSFHGAASLDGVAAIDVDPALPVAWRYDAGARIANTPVSDLQRERVFFADGDGVIHALDWQGNPVWSRAFRVPGYNGGAELPEMFDAPLRVVDDLLIAGGAMGILYALALEDGSLRWKTETEYTILGSPNVVTTEEEGETKTRILFVDQSNGSLQGLDLATGALLWSGAGINRCDGSPAASSAYVVYGSCASALHIFSPVDGTLLREIELGQDEQVAAGVVLLGETIYSSTRSGRFVCANARTGALVWLNASSDEEALYTPAVSANHVVFSDASAVHALRRDNGTALWRRELDNTPTTPIIAGNKVAVAAGGTLCLLDLNDGHVVATRAVSDEITPPGVAGTRLVVGGEDGVVTAFGEI